MSRYGQEDVLRIKGHRGTFETTNGVARKPRCSCGWVGAAGNMSQAKSLFDNHKDQVVLARKKLLTSLIV